MPKRPIDISDLTVVGCDEAFECWCGFTRPIVALGDKLAKVISQDGSIGFSLGLDLQRFDELCSQGQATKFEKTFAANFSTFGDPVLVFRRSELDSFSERPVEGHWQEPVSYGLVALFERSQLQAVFSPWAADLLRATKSSIQEFLATGFPAARVQTERLLPHLFCASLTSAARLDAYQWQALFLLRAGDQITFQAIRDNFVLREFPNLNAKMWLRLVKDLEELVAASRPTQPLAGAPVQGHTETRRLDVASLQAISDPRERFFAAVREGEKYAPFFNERFLLRLLADKTAYGQIRVDFEVALQIAAYPPVLMFLEATSYGYILDILGIVSFLNRYPELADSLSEKVKDALAIGPPALAGAGA